MRVYIFYLITAIVVAWMILFLYGVSSGFASYAPISALLGSIILFTIAAPAFIYKARVGLLVGFIGCLLMLPYMLIIVRGVFEDRVFNLGILVSIVPTVLILLSTYFTIKSLSTKTTFFSGIPSGAIVKLLLSGIPLALFVLYLLFYGKYWSWEMFRI